MEVVETEFDAPFIVKLFTILNWPAVLKAAETVELADGFPVEKPTSVADNEQLLQKLHHLLFEIDVLEGQLECAETGHVVPIVDGKLKSIED